MRARTFISLMLLLLAFTMVLLVFATPGKQEIPQNECPAGEPGNSNTQAGEGAIIWESVSRHLLNGMQ
jgi:uncharacterized protein involved in high-affinity Fe2+ transport